MAQKEWYARLQVLQNQASDTSLRYLVVRDKHFVEPKKLSPADAYEVQNAYQAEKAKLVALIREYNQLEAKLSMMESRQPRFFVLPIPPMAPKNLRIEEAGRDATGVHIRVMYDLPDPDPVEAQVERDVKDLYRQYGWEYPKKATPTQNK